MSVTFSDLPKLVTEKVAHSNLHATKVFRR